MPDLLRMPGHRIKTIQTAYEHLCGLTEDHDIYCWSGPHSFLLDGQQTSLLPEKLPLGEKALSFSVQGGHLCYINQVGQTKCLGQDGGTGRLGDGKQSDSITPVLVEGLGYTRQITGGLYLTCAIEVSGESKCWGEDFHASLGTIPSSDQAPVYPTAHPIDWGVSSSP